MTTETETVFTEKRLDVAREVIDRAIRRKEACEISERAQEIFDSQGGDDGDAEDIEQDLWDDFESCIGDAVECKLQEWIDECEGSREDEDDDRHWHRSLARLLDTTQLDWYVDPNEVIDAFIDGDAEGVSTSISRNEALAFVGDNAHALRERGIYEDVMLSAYSGVKHNTSDWDGIDLLMFFEFGDWSKHRDAIPDLQDGGKVTVYRGVSGDGEHRRECGVSWTTDLDTAASFAVKFSHLNNPQVLVAEVGRDDVFAYCDDRGEKEYLAYIKDYSALPITLAEMRAGWDRRCEQVRRGDREATDEHKAELTTA